MIPGQRKARGVTPRVLSGRGKSLPKSVIRSPAIARIPREGRHMTLHTGRHFLQIPGPTNIPDRVLRAMDMPALDHRGAEFAELGFAVFSGMQRIFRTKQPVIIFPSSGTGAWEAAIVNTLSPGDKVLMFETGQFATLWKDMAVNLRLDVQFVASDWRHGADPDAVESILREDRSHAIKAVGVVHNETSSAVTNSVPAI